MQVNHYNQKKMWIIGCHGGGRGGVQGASLNFHPSLKFTKLFSNQSETIVQAKEFNKSLKQHQHTQTWWDTTPIMQHHSAPTPFILYVNSYFSQKSNAQQ